MAPTSSAALGSDAPADIVTAEAIIDEKHKPGDFVNVIGIVQKILSPILTRAGQWKADVEIFDLSIQYDTELKLIYTVFHNSQDMLSDVRCGDVIVLLRAKVQSYGSRPSLLHNYQTSVFLFAADKIPSLTGDPTPALRSTPLSANRPLSSPLLRYVPVFFHKVDKERLPTVQEFDEVKVQSVAIKEKFLELKDATDMLFCDIKVNIVREPYDSGDKITLWVSDYTENRNFFNYVFDPLAGTGAEGQDGDEYGYLNAYGTGTGASATNWTGPYGQRSLQITCWGYHADVIRSYKLRIGSWIHIKNVQIKLGHNGGYLEGYLREDENAREKVRIHPMDPRGYGQTLDPQLKAALRRKQGYEKAKKNDLKAVAEAALAGQKRKASAARVSDDQIARQPQPNRKKRRDKEQMEKRAAEARAREAKELASKIQLNPAVRHEDHEVQPSSVKEITADKCIEVEHEGQQIVLGTPFINTSYRGNFRITDFKPDRLEDFAVPIKGSDEFAALSDNDESESDGSGSETGSETGSDTDPNAGFEWRFALKLEDAEAEDEDRQAFWALVDNKSAQYLTNIDATDLKRDANLREQLRETMFLLWGNLEEQKSDMLKKRDAAAVRARNGQPPDSSFEGPMEMVVKPDALSNLPFGCCIAEYGVKIQEPDDSKADAGIGYRWKRVHRLERTRIVKN